MRKHCTDCTFQWEDFSPVDYVNWQEGEPNDAGDGEGKDPLTVFIMIWPS